MTPPTATAGSTVPGIDRRATLGTVGTPRPGAGAQPGTSSGSAKDGDTTSPGSGPRSCRRSTTWLMTSGWMADGPPAVRCTFCTPDKDRPTQVPLILLLLEEFGYPDMAGISEDLHGGFVMLGDLRRDGRPERRPLQEHNYSYVRQRTSSLRPGKHSPALLEELVEETRVRPLSRARRCERPPCATARAWISCKSTRPATSSRPSPSPSSRRTRTATSSSGGARRRRSARNSTVRATDVPTHHFVGDLVDIAIWMAQVNTNLRLLGYDLLNAYRQWPVKEPAHCSSFLATGATSRFRSTSPYVSGRRLLQAGNFNRTTDAL